MNLRDIINRRETPEPWSEGEKIPWDDPEFSERMLNEHLSQDHDLASRRFEVIDRHVEWINKQIKPGSMILDLVCGPGLYSQRLTGLGHSCKGIDFGPASIRYAREEAEKAGFDIEYVLEDIRDAEYGSGYDLVMMIYGEFSVFKLEDTEKILAKTYDSLKTGGLFIAEPIKYETVKQEGSSPASWYASKGGLFNPDPHICLMENFWDKDRHIATTRSYIVDILGEVTLNASSSMAYTRKALVELFENAGFRDVVFHESLSGEGQDLDPNLDVVVARK